MLGHVLGMLTTEELPQTDVIQSFIVAFNMPLFFFVSGYVGGKLLKVDGLKNLWDIIKKAGLRMLLPAYSFTLLLMLIQPVSNPLIYFWFLHSLFKLYVIVAAVSWGLYNVRLGEKTKFALLVLICLCLSYALGNYVLEFVIYFIMGMIAKRYGIFQNVKIWRILVAMCIGIGIFAFTKDYSFYICKVKDMVKDMPHIWILRQICGLCFSYGLCGIFVLCSCRYSWFSQLGTMTLGFYLIHDYIVEMVMSGRFHIKLPLTEAWQWLLVFCFLVLLTAVCYATIRLLKINKYTRMIFLGEK